MSFTKKQLIEEVTRYYLESHQFNGSPTVDYKNRSNWNTIRDIVTECVKEQKIDVVFGDCHPNPHIKAFLTDHIDEQLKKIATKLFEGACLYPHPNHLKKTVKKSIYNKKPYTLCLALGEPQLSYKAFELSVLENYKNDPRYYYDNDDIHGKISISDDFYESDDVRKSDKVLLQTFGFCYDEDLNRFVAVYLRYLSYLSPEHQQIWYSKQVEFKTNLHPDYWRTTCGRWPEKISIFSAFLAEQRAINDICTQMGKPNLFMKTYDNHNKPREFCFLVRPTLKEYNNFIHTLDKLISDNINRNFFKNDIPYEKEEKRKDGKIIVRTKNTLKLLEEWMAKYFKPTNKEDNNAIRDMLETFKNIRNLRQKPAHLLQKDVFDNKYIHEQRVLFNKAYKGVRLIRLILENHPLVHNVDINDLVRDGKIWMV